MNAPRRSFFQTAVVLSAALHAVALALPAPANTPASGPTERQPAPAPRLSAHLLTTRSPAIESAAPRAALQPTLRIGSDIQPTPIPRERAAETVATQPAPAVRAPERPTNPSGPSTSDASDRPSAPLETAAAPAAPAKVHESALAVDTPPEHHADYLDNPKPVYPKFARDRGQQGRVLLAVRVGADGRPNVVRLEQSSGFPLLDAAAQDAVERWRFVPARRGATAIEAWAKVPIAFGLTQP